MRKLVLAFLSVSLTSVVCAGDFSLESFRARDIGAQAVPAPEASSAELQVPPELVKKFKTAKNELWKLESDTAWLASDLERLYDDARRMIQTNISDPFFPNNLQRMAWDMTRYNNEAQRLASVIKELLNLAQKDKELNTIARDLDWSARNILSRIQFDLENTAQRLEWALRGANPALVGYNSQWLAMDISRYSRDFVWKVRDISWDTQALISKTQP